MVSSIGFAPMYEWNLTLVQAYKKMILKIIVIINISFFREVMHPPMLLPPLAVFLESLSEAWQFSSLSLLLLSCWGSALTDTQSHMALPKWTQLLHLKNDMWQTCRWMAMKILPTNTLNWIPMLRNRRKKSRKLFQKITYRYKSLIHSTEFNSILQGDASNVVNKNR